MKQVRADGVFSHPLFCVKHLLLSLECRNIYRPVAQLAERRSPKPQVGGSIPSWPAS